MKRIFQIPIAIILILLISCEKTDVAEETYPANGTIYATVTYAGVRSGNWVQFYVCDIDYLDVISTMILQRHNELMDGNIHGGENIYNSFVQSLQTRDKDIVNDINGMYEFSRAIEPGTYVLVAEKPVIYNYPNVPTSNEDFTKRLHTTALQYKVITVESCQTTNVAFIFHDYISDAVEIY